MDERNQAAVWGGVVGSIGLVVLMAVAGAHARLHRQLQYLAATEGMTALVGMCRTTRAIVEEIVGSRVEALLKWESPGRLRKECPLNFRRLERGVIIGSRFFTLLAVVGSLAGAMLMFLLGLYNVGEAFWVGFHEEARFGSTAVITIIEGLDRFLIAIVLLYFAYGVYSLFIHPEESEEELAIPAWLRVKQIGQLKQVVAEVIIVVLFVLFLRNALQTFREPNFPITWEQIAALALLPFCTMLLALSLRLVELHPKPERPSSQENSEQSNDRER
jgi:uncharacterized membrane protein YqhA